MSEVLTTETRITSVEQIDYDNCVQTLKVCFNDKSCITETRVWKVTDDARVGPMERRDTHPIYQILLEGDVSVEARYQVVLLYTDLID